MTVPRAVIGTGRPQREKEPLDTTASDRRPRVAVVIPAYKVPDRILGVLGGIGPEVDHIYVVDDACPEGSGDVVEMHRGAGCAVRGACGEHQLGVGDGVGRRREGERVGYIDFDNVTRRKGPQ